VKRAIKTVQPINFTSLRNSSSTYMPFLSGNHKPPSIGYPLGEKMYPGGTIFNRTELL